MKQLLICLYMIISCYCKAQSSGWYIGNSMGITRSSHVYFDAEEKVNEKYKSTFIFYAMPIGYQFSNNLIFESGWLYSGAVLANVMAGKKFPVNETISIDLLAGISDDIGMIKPFKITQRIIPTASIRLSGNHLYIHSNFYKDGYLIGIGVKGFLFK